MVQQLLRLTVVAALVGATQLKAEPEAGAAIDDPGLLATADGPWAAAMQARLAAFERDTGIRILLQFHLKSPPADEDKQPGAYMRALAAKLGLIRHGVLVVYFADDPDWRVWVGDELTPVFVGKPGDAREFTESGAMHRAKEAFLAASLAKADAAFAALEKSAPPNETVSRRKRVTLQAGALVDGLCSKLSPR